MDTPAHYDMNIEPIDFIMANGLRYAEGNVIKYVCRHGLKGGAEDLKKAIHYCQFILEMDYGVASDVRYEAEELGRMAEEGRIICDPPADCVSTRYLDEDEDELDDGWEYGAVKADEYADWLEPYPMGFDLSGTTHHTPRCVYEEVAPDTYQFRGYDPRTMNREGMPSNSA